MIIKFTESLTRVRLNDLWVTPQGSFAFFLEAKET